MMLLRVLHAEMLKMKRTIALKMVVLAPVIVLLLVFFMVWQLPYSALHCNGIKDEWTGLESLALFFWALLMMPLYVTVEGAHVAGLDHSENHWKNLLARPVPGWTFPVAKLIVLVAMTAVATLVLLCGILLSGAILPRVQPEVRFGFPVPWLAIVRDCTQVMGLMFLPLTIQQWVSLRWRSFSVATGTGFVETVIAFFAVAVFTTNPRLATVLPMGLAHAGAGQTSSLHRNHGGDLQCPGCRSCHSHLPGLQPTRSDVKQLILSRRRRRCWRAGVGSAYTTDGFAGEY